MTSDQIARDIAIYTKEAEGMQEKADANRANGFERDAAEYQRFADNARAMAEELKKKLEQ